MQEDERSVKQTTAVMYGRGRGEEDAYMVQGGASRLKLMGPVGPADVGLIPRLPEEDNKQKWVEPQQGVR